MKHWIAGLAVLLFAAHAAAAALTPQTIYVGWQLSVDAQGRVTALHTDDTQAPALHAPLEKAIRTWSFTPGKVDGEPAATDSLLYVALRLQPDGEDRFKATVIGATVGGGYGQQPAPRYPQSMVLSRREGLVVLRVKYDAQGAVVDVAPYAGAPAVVAPFVEAATEAVKRWTFTPERVGGHALGGAVLVPVCFRLQGAPRHIDCNWKRPDGLAGDASAVALNPAARLETDVRGATL